MTIELIQASAHHLPMIADESVHCIVTSPPFWSLRRYEGNQDILWPTVEYAPMPGLPPIRIQGCEPGCSHEWGEPILGRTAGGGGNAGMSERLAEWEAQNRGTTVGTRQPLKVEGQGGQSVTQGAYCRHCSGWRGALGLEPSIEMYIGHLMLCLREWRRVLRSDGTCWVNLGDSYVANGPRSNTNGSGTSGLKNDGRPEASRQHSNSIIKTKGLALPAVDSGIPAKNLSLIPARFALAAQAEGWWIRSDLIWSKPNPMPESVTSRPTKSHEYIFLLAKSQDYFYDAEAVREENRITAEEHYIRRIKRPHKATLDDPELNGIHRTKGGFHKMEYNPAGRNLRSVLHLATQPFPGAHFATFPERIPEIAILAGTSARGCCPQCGAGYVRCVENGPSRNKHLMTMPSVIARGLSPTSCLNHSGEYKPRERVDFGWQPACSCNAGEPVSATVMDPFSGSCTTGRVALRLGRSYIGVDLAESYLNDITTQRLGDGVQMELAW